MKESEKRRFDAILALYQRALDQFNERRKFEVQVSLAFWTTLVLAIAGSLNLAAFPKLPGGRVTLGLLALAIVVVNGMWHDSIWRSNRLDRARALDYQAELHSLADFRYTNDTEKRLSGAQAEQISFLSNSSHRFQFALTLLLAASLVLVNWSRFASSP